MGGAAGRGAHTPSGEKAGSRRLSALVLAESQLPELIPVSAELSAPTNPALPAVPCSCALGAPEHRDLCSRTGSAHLRLLGAEAAVFP